MNTGEWGKADALKDLENYCYRQEQLIANAKHLHCEGRLSFNYYVEYVRTIETTTKGES